MIRYYFAALLCGFALVGQASSEWRSGTVDGQFVIFPRTEGPIPMLGCGSDGRRSLMIATDGGEALFSNQQNLTRKYKARRARLFVNEEQVFSQRVIWIPAWKVAQTNDSSAFRVVYNAAVQQEELRFTLNGYGSMELPLPAADDTFRQFAECITG